ncbi:MAG: hypothetical protein K0B37_13005 [Bacteroidales bacterium]|nr:hypothetical protein [Bacteroidales bacterium]
MKNILIILVGNREIQVRKDSPVLSSFPDMWVPNNDDPDFMIVNKSLSFLENSKVVYQNYNQIFRDAIEFPMISLTIKEVHEPLSEIVFIASKQNPTDKQDCYYFGELAKEHFKSKFTDTKVLNFDFNPTDFRTLLEFYIQLFNQYEGYNVYVGNSGGTPDMRAATYMAGVFRNIQFITINARNKTANKNNFKSQENAILKHIIDKMLTVYDYEGIKYLPVSDDITKECVLALDLYNLVSDKAGSLIPASDNYNEKSMNAIMLLINNMTACYRQGRYTDVIGRIFRIEEAIWHLLFFRELKSHGLIDNSDKYRYVNSQGKNSSKKFEKLLSNDQLIQAIITNNYPDVLQGGCFRLYPEVPFKSGKNFFYYFFLSIDKNLPVCNYFAKINSGYDLSQNKLSQLRNNSIMGHGFKGISKDDIFSIVGLFDKFMEELVKLVNEHLDIPYKDIFTEVNNRISRLIGNYKTSVH